MLDVDVGLSKPTGIRHKASGLIGQHGAYFGFQQALSFLGHFTRPPWVLFMADGGSEVSCIEALG
jgi:hypothetical protein